MVGFHNKEKNSGEKTSNEEEVVLFPNKRNKFLEVTKKKKLGSKERNEIEPKPMRVLMIDKKRNFVEGYLSFIPKVSSHHCK